MRMLGYALTALCWLPTALLSQSVAQEQTQVLTSDLDVLAFYSHLPQKALDGLPPVSQFVPAIEKTISTGSKATIATLWPYLTTDMADPNPRVRKLAVMGITLVSNRPDGSEFLRQSPKQLLNSLSDDDLGVANEFAFGMRFAGSTLPDPIVAGLSAYLMRSDAAEKAGPSVVTTLLLTRSKDKSLSEGISSFLSRPGRSPAAQIQLLRAVSIPGVDDSIIGVVRNILKTSVDHNVRLTAMIAVDRIGPRARTICAPELQAIAASNTESGEIRTMATSVLSRKRLTATTP